MDSGHSDSGRPGERSYPWPRAGHGGACMSRPGGAPGGSGWSFSPAGVPGTPWWAETGQGRGGDEGRRRTRTRRRTGGTVGAVRRRRLEGVGDLEKAEGGGGGQGEEGCRYKQTNRWQCLTVRWVGGAFSFEACSLRHWPEWEATL